MDLPNKLPGQNGFRMRSVLIDRNFIFAIAIIAMPLKYTLDMPEPVTYFRLGSMERLFLLYIYLVFSYCPKFKMGL